MPKKMSPTKFNTVIRKRTRQHLHDQLDALLNGQTTEDDGEVMSVLDSMVKRALAGYGFNVRVHTLHPAQTETVKEAPGTVVAGPQVSLVRDHDEGAVEG